MAKITLPNGAIITVPDPDPAQAVGQAVGGLAKTLGEVEALPEVRQAAMDEARATGDAKVAQEAVLNAFTGGYGVGTSDAQLRDMVQARYPDATFRESGGGLIASIGGQEYWLNKPGVSGQDLDNVRVSLAASAPLALPAGGAGTAAGRFLTGALAGGGTEVAMDVAAGASGSQQGVDATRAGIAAGLGGVADLVLPKIVGAVGRWIRQGRAPVVNGQPSREVRRLLGLNGIDPDSIPAATWQNFADIVERQKPDDLMAAFRQAEAASLPGSPALTTAQATQNPEMMRAMAGAEQGLLGNRARTIAGGARAQQQQALSATAEAVQQQLGGGVIGAPGQGGALAANELVGRAATEKAGVKSAYDLARSIGADAATPEGAFKTWGQAVTRVLDERGFDLDMMPAASKYLNDIAGMGDNLPGLMKWRSRVTNAIRDAGTPSERATLSIMLDGFDEWLDDVAGRGLLSGDPAALSAWKDAMAKNRQFRSLFERKSITDMLVDTAGEAPQLKVAPDDAVNVIFGKGELGSKTGLATDLGRLRNVLGAQSDAWKAIKEEAFLRLFRSQPQAEGTGALLTGRFKPGAYNKALATALRDQPTAMRMLFSADEIKQLQQFGRVLEYAYGLKPMPQNVNPSGTAALASTIGKRTLGNMGFLGQATLGVLGKLLGPISDMANALSVERMARGVLPSTLPKFTTAPAVAAGVSE